MNKGRLFAPEEERRLSPSSPQQPEVCKDHVLVISLVTARSSVWHAVGISDPMLNGQGFHGAHREEVPEASPPRAHRGQRPLGGPF